MNQLKLRERLRLDRIPSGMPMGDRIAKRFGSV
jgi:hypothetical protein